ncbi:unnamed protein product [Sympodiomycopsis kandeliae]
MLFNHGFLLFLISSAISTTWALPAVQERDLLKGLLGGDNKASHGHNKHGGSVKEPKHFTSAFSTRAIPSTVIANSGAPAPGQQNAFGHFGFRINSKEDIICWDIRTVNVTGDYSSPAVTATHIHQADVGKAGPPRIAFPNPTFVRTDSTGAEVRESKGCQKGPFRTGINAADGNDTGSASGFTLSQIEQNPSAFFADTHTAQFSAGAVRGQLLASEKQVDRPRYFTSTLKTEATSDQVVNANNVATPGLKSAKSYYKLELNTDSNILCYEILSTGFKGEYFSPAKTATHTHQAAFGRNGPPRIAFKNPEPIWDANLVGKLLSKFGIRGSGQTRYSKECVQGPFTTGLLGADGVDTGSASGFTLNALQDNPAGFFSDYHTEAFATGAVRGQLYKA